MTFPLMWLHLTQMISSKSYWTTLQFSSQKIIASIATGPSTLWAQLDTIPQWLTSILWITLKRPSITFQVLSSIRLSQFSSSTTNTLVDGLNSKTCILQELLPLCTICGIWIKSLASMITASQILTMIPAPHITPATMSLICADSSTQICLKQPKLAAIACDTKNV